MGIRVEGEMVPKPITKFPHLKIDNTIHQIIAKKGYEKPTGI
jgi:hypothetical protein